MEHSHRWPNPPESNPPNSDVASGGNRTPEVPARPGHSRSQTVGCGSGRSMLGSGGRGHTGQTVSVRHYRQFDRSSTNPEMCEANSRQPVRYPRGVRRTPGRPRRRRPPSPRSGRRRRVRSAGPHTVPKRLNGGVRELIGRCWRSHRTTNPRVASLPPRTGCPRSRQRPRSRAGVPRRVHRHVRRCEVFHRLFVRAGSVLSFGSAPHRNAMQETFRGRAVSTGLLWQILNREHLRGRIHSREYYQRRVGAYRRCAERERPVAERDSAADYASCDIPALRVAADKYGHEDIGSVDVEVAAGLDEDDDLECIASTSRSRRHSPTTSGNRGTRRGHLPRPRRAPRRVAGRRHRRSGV